jgi:ribose transport system permease protein
MWPPTSHPMAQPSPSCSGCVVGLIVGSANGVGVTVFRVNPLIMTLAMSGILLGLFTCLDADDPGRLDPSHSLYQAAGRRLVSSARLALQRFVWAGFRACADLAAAALRLGAIALCDRRQRGGGAAGWRAGLAGAHRAAYIVAGVLGSISGILLAGRTGAVDLQIGWRLSAALGCRSCNRRHLDLWRRGRLHGTILGALILSVLNSMLTFLNVGQAIQQVVYGVIVLSLAWGYAGLTRRG